MKGLLYTVVFILIVCPLFSLAHTINADDTNVDDQEVWIQSLLKGQNLSIKDNDYLFYCTGHHGIIWSLIISDSSGINLYSGTTRNNIELSENSLPDSLSFIKDNIKTIDWGLDSLLNAAQLLVPIKKATYNPIYSQLYVKKDGKLTFTYSNQYGFYAESDSIEFHNNLSKLVYLMYWLASPSVRSYLPIPNDVRSMEH